MKRTLLVLSVLSLAVLPSSAVSAPSGSGQSSAALAWCLPPYATLEGDILTVDVPEEAARQGCRVEAHIDLSAYDGVPLEAEVEARGERIARPRDAWNGLKFQFEYVDPETGDRQYPNTASRLGDFPRQTLRVRDSLCAARRDAILVLGLQDTSGKVVFDLSTLRICEGRPFWPVTNQTHRCEYTTGTTGTTATASSCGKALQALPVPPDGGPEGGAVFRGVMSPGRDMTEDDFATLRDWGATLLRYQMIRDWGKAGTNRDIAEYDQWLEGRLAHFESFVLPMCRKYGLKVVLDLHVTPGGRNAQGEFCMFFEREYADYFVEKWAQIAARFAPIAQTMGPVIYGYDLCNEPVQYAEALPECDWWSLQRRAAEAIREIDPETPIIVESNNWDVPQTWGVMSPLALTNVIYQVHVYNPYHYTHQGVHRPVDAPVAYPGPGMDKDYIRRILAPVRAFEKRHGAKIYVGEFSAIAWAPGAENYLRDCIDLFEEYGWDWTYHAFRESRVWYVEMEGPNWPKMVPVPDSPRKRALLDGLRR
ncbi:MAG: cellulase family glycosylhydrolase [Kiritimatiellae bacterium]|nr:cellulase family glycosylhydrolase [Kiritimatiellia bacterium]